MKRFDGSEDEGSSKILRQSNGSYVRADGAAGAGSTKGNGAIEGGLMMNADRGLSGQELGADNNNNAAQQALDNLQFEYTECAACGKLVAGILPMMDVLMLVAEPAEPVIPGAPHMVGLDPKLCIEEIVCLECGKAFEAVVQKWAESQDVLMLARGGEAMPTMFAPVAGELGSSSNQVRYKTIVETCDQTDDGGDYAYCWWLTDDQVKGLCAAIHHWRNDRLAPRTELEVAANTPFEPLDAGGDC